MAGELAVVGSEKSVADIRRTATLIAAQRDAIVQLMRDVMVEDVDYGTIPGTPKPTLYKPGSEKLLSMFRMAGKPVVEDLSTPDMIRYQVHFVITDGHGNFLGEGIGECSSAESKYQWRKAVCAEEWESFPEDRRRIKWKKGQNNTEQQVRAEMEDVANTVLKIAKKRSQIDGVLTVTAASDVFSQDIEDLKEAGIDPAPEQGIVDAKANNGGSPTLQRKQSTETQSVATASGTSSAVGATQQQGHPPTQQQAKGRPITEPQSRRFYAIARQSGKSNDDISEYLQKTFGVRRSDEIPAARYEDAIKWAEERQRKEFVNEDIPF